MNRLFISLDLPENVITQIIDLRDKICLGKNIKWEPTEKFHLTIKFIGDISDEMIDVISNELLFVNNYQPIKCSFNKFGFFYRDAKPFILWAGVSVGESIHEIITGINNRFEKFSIPDDQRKFNPHITLLRMKNDPGNNFVNNFKNFTFEPILFTTNSITLYKSILRSEGSKYFEIKNYKLKKLE